MHIIKYKADGLKPGITLDRMAGKFEISGKSCPENVVEFYQPILDWIDKYSENPLDETIFEFKLQYYNTASSKVLFVLMQKLETIVSNGHQVKIKWYYPEDDEALQEAGEEYDDLIEVDFDLIATDPES
jgi:hypothetical protein